MRFTNNIIQFFILLVCFSIIFCYGQSSQLPADKNLNDLQRYFESKVNQFKIDLHRSFEQARITRKNNRNNLWTLSKSGVNEKHFRVDGISNVKLNFSTNQPVTTWTAIESDSRQDQTLLFWGLNNGVLALANFYVTAVGAEAKVIAYHYEYDIGVPVKSSYFRYGTYVWLVVGYNNRDREFIVIYQVTQTSSTYQQGYLFFRRQTIETGVEFDFDVLDTNSQIYLAITCARRKTTTGTTSEAAVRLYEWRHTQFDYIAQQSTYAAKSVRLFVISGMVYVAVAQMTTSQYNNNYNPNDQLPTGSPIFLYNSRDDHRLTYHQIVNTHSSHRVQHFYLEGSHYLLFISSTHDAKIFWHVGDQFIEYQLLHNTRHAVNLAVTRLPNNEVLLVLIFKHTAKFYTQSLSSQYVVTKEIHINHPNINTVKIFNHFISPTSVPYYFLLFSSLSSLSSLSSHQHSLFGNFIWKLNLAPFEVKQQLDYDPLFICLRKLEEQLTEREVKVHNYLTKIDRVWVVNRQQKITAPVLVKGRLLVNNINTKNLVINNPNINKHVTNLTNTQIKSRLDFLNDFLNRIKTSMKNVVFKSSNQTITGPMTFVSPIHTFATKINHISNEDVKINRIKLTDLKENFLKINGDQIITGQYIFKNNITVNNLILPSQINNLNVNDILYTNSKHLQQVHGRHKFGDVIIKSDLRLSSPRGKINGISLDEFVLVNGVNQRINGRKTFHTLVCKKNIRVSGLVNGRSLKQFFLHQAVKLNAPSQIINGRVSFVSPLTVNNLVVDGRINRLVNLTHLAHYALNTHSTQTLYGRKSFLNHVVVYDNLNVNGYLNGIKLNNLVTLNTQQVLTGNLTFKSPVVFTQNIITKFMNGFDFSSEVIRKNSPEPQEIYGLKVFKEDVTVIGDISMSPGTTINGIDLSEIQHMITARRNALFSANLTFDNLIVHGNIQVPTINHYSINNLPTTIWLKSAEQPIVVPVTFAGQVKVNNLVVNQLNSFKFPEDFVLKSSSYDIITGNKTFYDFVQINGNLDIKEGKRINGYDLSYYDSNVVRKNLTGSHQAIVGFKRFTSVKIKGNVLPLNKLYANYVNGLDLTRDVMLTNSPQTINVDVSFVSPVTIVKKMFEADEIYGTLNNVSLSKFASEIVYFGDYKTLTRPIRNKLFLGQVESQRLLVHGLINHIDINNIKNRVVLLDRPQVIYASKNFTRPVIYQSHVQCNLLNNLDMNQYVTQVVYRNQPNLVYGNKVFRGNVVFRKNLNVGLVNGIDLRSLNRRAMFKSRYNVVHAPMTFFNNLTVNHLNVDAHATIDGIKPVDMVLLNDNVKFNGFIKLNNGALVNGNILVKKLVNNCDLSKLFIEAVRLDSSNILQVVYGTKVFRNFEVIGNVITNSFINNMNINEFMTKIVTKITDQSVFSPVTFVDRVYVKNLYVHSLVNQLNLTSIFNDAVLRHQPQTILGDKEFTNYVIFNGGNVKANHMSINGLVNNVDIVKLNSTAVRRDDNLDIYGTKIFLGPVRFMKDVHVKYYVNDLKIPNDLVLVNSTQFIPAKVVFKNLVTFNKNLYVNGLVDGVQLSKYYHDRVTLFGENELITSQLNFTQHLSIDHLIVKHTINGIPINSFVTVNGRHIINGEKIFKNGLTVHGHLTSYGRFNGIDLQDLSNRAINIHKPQLITGVTEFTQPVQIMSHMKINGKLNGIDISDMANFFKNVIEKVNIDVNTLKQQINFQEDQIISLFNSHLTQYSTGIDYFELSDERAINNRKFYPVFSINVTTSNKQLFYIVSNEYLRSNQHLSCESSNVYNYQPINVYQFTGHYWKHIQTIDIYGVISMASFNVVDETYVVMASNYLQTTYILQYRGYNLFETIQSFSTPDVQSLRPHWFNNTLNLEVSSNNFVKNYKAIFSGPIMRKHKNIDEMMHIAEVNSNK